MTAMKTAISTTTTTVVPSDSGTTTSTSTTTYSSTTRVKKHAITFLLAFFVIGFIDTMSRQEESVDFETMKTKKNVLHEDDNANDDVVILHENDPIEVAQQQEEQQPPQALGIDIDVNVQLPLKYPFRIIQYGQPRSGSTFQYELLKAIMYLKSPDIVKYPKEDYYENKMNGNLIFKVHDIHSLRKELKRTGGGSSGSVAAGSFTGNDSLSIFVSGDVLYNSQVDKIRIISNATTSSSSYQNKTVTTIPIVQLFDDNDDEKDIVIHYHPIYHHQLKYNLYNCSLCEIDYYQSIFDLTYEDLLLLKEYMMYYQILRQCCGFQMSKYNLYRIHNCNITKYMNLSEYPNCENQNISYVEYEFAYHQPIPYMSLNPKLLWNVPGDCEKYENEIITQNLHNNNHKIKFKGCPPSR